MAKIGILTYHRSINYGSFLQCYSIIEGIKNSGDHDVEVINYNPISTENKRYLDLLTRNISDIPLRVKKLFVFNKHIKEHLILSGRRLFTNNLTKAHEFINAQNYDAVIVGSDEVWKITRLRGFPNVYWLGEQLNCKKFSYAASLNKSEILPDRMADKSRRYMSNALSDYIYIGVRDELTKNQIQLLNKDLKINLNPDPTFMYQLNEEVRNSLRYKLESQYKINFSKPLIGIMTGLENVGKRVRELYAKEYELISYGVRNKYADKNIYDIDPFEFAEIFSFCSLVVTSFFHGTVFSIKNNVPFISIENNYLYKNYKSKINDLLTRNGLAENYFYMGKDFDMKRFDERSRFLLSNINDADYDLVVENNRRLFHVFIEDFNRCIQNR